ncbi:MAG: hypothetical protein ACLUEQ_04195 [Cloacibacillus evryensis]
MDYNDSVAGDSVLVFDNVKADFSGATIMEMDRVEIANGTELTLSRPRRGEGTQAHGRLGRQRDGYGSQRKDE